jgi:hypothetical protein
LQTRSEGEGHDRWSANRQSRHDWGRCCHCCGVRSRRARSGTASRRHRASVRGHQRIQLRVRANPFSGIPSDNWSYYGCRNIDGSLYNNTPFTFRVYFAPNHGDPHACIPPFTKVSDLFNYDFNSGSGPHNLVIGNDIASFSFNLSPCTATPL